MERSKLEPLKLELEVVTGCRAKRSSEGRFREDSTADAKTRMLDLTFISHINLSHLPFHIILLVHQSRPEIYPLATARPPSVQPLCVLILKRKILALHTWIQNLRLVRRDEVRRDEVVSGIKCTKASSEINPKELYSSYRQMSAYDIYDKRSKGLFLTLYCLNRARTLGSRL
jgi:hypothetical protein